MKRTPFASLALLMAVCLQLLCNTATAKDIGQATARRLGAYYMSVMTNKAQVSDSKVSLAYTFQNSTRDIPAAYVFNVGDQGFVIVSASDYCYPILGYSTEGLLDSNTMAPAFREFFGSMAVRISYAQDNDLSLFSDTEKIDLEWEQLYNSAWPAEPAPKATQWMLDECWDQGDIHYPTYNKMCPSGPDEYGRTGYAYVGCVATAMAQIMHYWRYPEHGNGYIGGIFYLNQGTSYQQYLGYIDINLADYTYDWANMPDQNLSYYSSDVQKNACALLCYHCGISVSMNYGFSGSGTQSSYVPDAMNNKFGYARVEHLRRSRVTNYVAGGETFIYSDDEWINMMHGEIDSLRPIYYSGYSMAGNGRDAGGHAFVADGYKSAQPDKFHFNWGWGGQPNTWSDLRTGDLSIPSSYGGYNFYFGQAMCYHIHPPIDEPQCSSVSNLHMTDSTSTSATFAWDGDSDQTYWRVAYGPSSDSLSEFQTIESTIKEYTVQGLTPGTWYSICVQGRCRHTCQYSNGIRVHDTIIWSPYTDTVRFYVGYEPLGIEEAEPELLSIQPNPAHSKTLLRSATEMSLVEIYTLDGRLLRQQKTDNAFEMVLDLSGLAPETYMLRVSTSKGKASKKLVVR